MFPYEWARKFLERTLRQQLPSDLNGAAREIVELHLNPANYTMPANYDQVALKRALAGGANTRDARRLIKF